MAWNNDQVSELETKKISQIAERCLELEGDFVELGCYKGDTSLILASILEKSGKKLWIYDSFEGLPKKAQEDESAMGQEFKEGELFVTKREVKARFLRAGLKIPIIKKAWFQDLTQEDLPEKIAFAFLDGDFYESMRISLGLVWDRMVDEGIILIHDYDNPALPGVALAVDEWMKDKNLKDERYQSLNIIKK
ncbi:class I SAM-dependent methyltransferase [Candidatus Saccharibacteria bacterium]|nr:class I SAM-dependent methyltransferase [Candidatus Saccharibacteria bacterium]